MAFNVSKTPKRIEAEFQYVNSAAGYTEEDGLKLHFRSHTIDEINEFDQRISDALIIKSNRKAGHGFRDRAKDPRSREVEYRTDAKRVFEINRDQIRTSLYDWEGFVDEDTAEPLPYSFEAFLRAAEQLPDLFSFAIECVDEISKRGNKIIRDAEKNLPSGSTID